jgi:Lipopolysaccharide-assembly
LKNNNHHRILTLLLLILAIVSLQGTCRYSMKDVSIEPEAKTVKVNYIENKARYVNPLLSPRLTEKLRQKIVNQTRLSQTNGEADYEIFGTITDYSVSTSGISNQQVASNNLNVTVSLIFKNKINEKKNFETSITRNFPFSSTLSLQQAETQLAEQILNNLTDEIFNKIFSSW